MEAAEAVEAAANASAIVGIVVAAPVAAMDDGIVTLEIDTGRSNCFRCCCCLFHFDCCLFSSIKVDS